jgi:D-arabinose 1-dehydrogenase-like Zn-dependent alcohol dehydrogenase
MALRIDAPTAGYVSYIDNWDPDWRATVDRQPVAVEQVLGTFKAVAIETIGVVTARHPATTFIVSGPNYLIEYQALVKIEAIGLNFLDCYFRSGLYKVPLPFTPGSEASGTVTAIAPDVTTVRIGDRVSYAPTMGAYAEYAVVPADRLIPVPDAVDARTAAAVTLQGMTAQYLATSTKTQGHHAQERVGGKFKAPGTASCIWVEFRPVACR